MKTLDEIIKNRPRGFKQKLIEENNASSSTVHNWQANGYVVHEGVLYKKMRKIKGLS